MNNEQKPPTPEASGAGSAQPPNNDQRQATASAKPGVTKPPAKKAPVTPTSPTDPAPPEDLEVPSFITALQAAYPNAIEQLSYWVGDWTVIVVPEHLIAVSEFLKDAPDGGFDLCSDVTVSDWPARPKRFDVVYCLYSTQHRYRVRLKVRTDENGAVPSVSDVWPAANWLECEVYDMFGVNITGHPDRRRILMPEEWQGYPQRKDYPLEGPGELLMEGPQDWLRLRNLDAENEGE